MALGTTDPLGFLALAGAFLFVMVIVMIAVYIYSAIALMAIAKRTNTPNGWLAWIPIANIYLMTQIGKQSGWWTLGILVAFIPVLGTLAVLALIIFLGWHIAIALNRPNWWGILLAIPIVNLVIMGIMAWGANPAGTTKSKKK